MSVVANVNKCRIWIQRSINQNTIDFITALIIHIKNIFKIKIKELLRKTENNNFFTTIFILNVKEMEKEDSTLKRNQSDYYLLNISNIDILNNEIICKIKKEFLKLIREGNDEIIIDESIKIRLNYKIPGFFNIYKKIKAYIEKEKLLIIYKQEETDLRECEYELAPQFMKIFSIDVKTFNEKLYTELISKPLVNKVLESKNIDIEFIKLFLNDYITFYLENLYNNLIDDFIINDIPHKIILLLLDLKFKEFNEEEKYKIPLQDTIAKILGLEVNSKYIKDILDLYNIISENIVYDQKEKDFLFDQLLKYFKK